jgi:hypothetical protein
MPDSRSHRGLAPEDDRLFNELALGSLRQASSDLCWLLNRGYSARSALELVGNRYSLSARQRMAVGRCACSDDAKENRRCREIGLEEVAGQELWIDGLNLVTGIEVALSGGIILVGRDGCYRDIAGLHRQYRKVEETLPALELIGQQATQLGCKKCCWWLDKPVSNSGRLKRLILELARQKGWNWEAELVYSPDAVLAKTEQVVVTSDSAILDRCTRWLNLGRIIISRTERARLVDLSRFTALLLSPGSR